MKRSFYIASELSGRVRERVLEIQEWADRKLARTTTPHITLAGSSGVGPIPGNVAIERIREALEPVAAATAPFTVTFGAPMRFMQTDIIVLPLDPHGALRALHERIATCGLPFDRPRFAFAPHCTLSFFPQLTTPRARRLLTERVAEPVEIERLQCYFTVSPVGGRTVLDVPLGAATAAR